jgi:hypothetical protein
MADYNSAGQSIGPLDGFGLNRLDYSESGSIVAIADCCDALTSQGTRQDARIS